MAEEKKDIKKEEKAEEKEVKETSPVSDTKKEETQEIKDKKEEKEEKLDLEPEKESKKKETYDDELPDDIKKKLEERKNDKSANKKKGRKKRKEKTRTEVGKAYVKATYNNTIVTLTDLNGNVLSWASAGVAGFKGPKKATSYAAQIISKIACIKAREDYGLKDVSVFVSGVGTGRESAVRSLNANGLNVTSIKDITPIPHNGCRPKKPRRV
ncbi:30S ribosomal protein S11 [Candidatus Falkowbacteria bacterium]|nr:30S ribosomal protein S11 [Candidatus Falkowbacteria bacterium]